MTMLIMRSRPLVCSTASRTESTSAPLPRAQTSSTVAQPVSSVPARTATEKTAKEAGARFRHDLGASLLQAKLGGQASSRPEPGSGATLPGSATERVEEMARGLGTAVGGTSSNHTDQVPGYSAGNAMGRGSNGKVGGLGRSPGSPVGTDIGELVDGIGSPFGSKAPGTDIGSSDPSDGNLGPYGPIGASSEFGVAFGVNFFADGKVSSIWGASTGKAADGFDLGGGGKFDLGTGSFDPVGAYGTAGTAGVSIKTGSEIGDMAGSIVGGDSSPGGDSPSTGGVTGSSGYSLDAYFQAAMCKAIPGSPGCENAFSTPDTGDDAPGTQESTSPEGTPETAGSDGADDADETSETGEGEEAGETSNNGTSGTSGTSGSGESGEDDGNGDDDNDNPYDDDEDSGSGSECPVGEGSTGERTSLAVMGAVKAAVWASRGVKMDPQSDPADRPGVTGKPAAEMHLKTGSTSPAQVLVQQRTGQCATDYTVQPYVNQLGTPLNPEEDGAGLTTIPK